MIEYVILASIIAIGVCAGILLASHLQRRQAERPPAQPMAFTVEVIRYGGETMPLDVMALNRADAERQARAQGWKVADVKLKKS